MPLGCTNGESESGRKEGANCLLDLKPPPQMEEDEEEETCVGGGEKEKGSQFPA